LLANVYLHYVFDLWADHWRKHEATGEVVIVRYADDAVIGFQNESDARRFLEQLRGRMGKFQLELHPEKTRLIRFGRFAGQSCRLDGRRKPEVVNFLGFSHICGSSQKGRFLLLRHTIAKRLRTKLREIKDGLRRRLHDPVTEQGRWLRSVVTGYYNYYGVPTNLRALQRFRFHVTRLWFRSLRRRSQRHRLDWVRMNRLAKLWLPPAELMHPWPWDRFLATTQGKSRVR
jgi:RNA-directed DNA polymerase